MNLRIKANDFEIEINNVDASRFEKTLMATMSILDGGEKFIETYQTTKVDRQIVNNKNAHFIEAVDGVREHSNGVKEYKCKYSCGCGNQGYRYIHDDAETTTCHRCKGELSVFPSTENDAHDEDFNYFIAY